METSQPACNRGFPVVSGDTMIEINGVRDFFLEELMTRNWIIKSYPIPQKELQVFSVLQRSGC